MLTSEFWDLDYSNVGWIDWEVKKTWIENPLHKMQSSIWSNHWWIFKNDDEFQIETRVEGPRNESVDAERTTIRTEIAQFREMLNEE